MQIVNLQGDESTCYSLEIRRSFSWRLFGRNSFFFLLVAAFCGTSPSYSANTISEPQHPSHFILLIDASGSTIASKSRRERYRAVLLQHVLPQLFSGTRSAGIPPFDPRQDFVSVFH